MLKVLLITLIFMLMPAGVKAAGKNEIEVKISAGGQVLSARFIDNATSRALISKFPLSIPMRDLYSREMCHNFPDPLPASELETSGYEIGDIIYWAPRHSFVIMYKQNGERISNLQKVGHIESGVEIFKATGDIEITLELADN